MDTVLILTDFSDSSRHAAKYALTLAGRFGVKRLLLVNTYQVVTPATDIPLEPDAGEDLRQISLRKLHAFWDTLRTIDQPSFTAELACVEGDLVEAVNEIATSEKADLVVMGMTGKSNVITALMGSNSSRLLNGCDFPLLVVPNDAHIEIPERVALATALKKSKRNMSSGPLSHFLRMFRPILFVVNVATGEESYDSEMQKGISDLHELLDRYGAQYHYITATNVIDGINAFVREHRVSLIIAIHETHTGLTGIFHKSISKKLASQVAVPLLILPQKKIDSNHSDSQTH